MSISAIAGSTQDTLPLAEIALMAAIEIEQNEQGKGSTEWLRRLSEALSSDADDDLGLVPVFDRALHSSDGSKVETKADLYAKLNAMSQRLLAVDDNSQEHDKALLRDFCVALHDGLLNQGYQAHYRTVSNTGLNA